MISKKHIDYLDPKCSVTEVENYNEAALDPTRVWKLFHRNLITGIGRITHKTLSAVGKFFHVPASELIFLPKSEVKKIEAEVPLTEAEGHGLNLVLKFWIRMNPDRPFKELTQDDYERTYNSVRRLRILWNQMKARCYNENSQDFQFYGAKGVRVCGEWLSDSSNFVMWALENGYTYYPEKQKGDQLSIDRIDPSKNYQPSNCRWIPQRENCSRTRGVDWDFVIGREYHFAELFPIAAYICYGRARMNWKVVRDKYMNGDTQALVQFLKDNCYTPMAIWRIRKNLGEVVPQKKSERGN